MKPSLSRAARFSAFVLVAVLLLAVSTSASATVMKYLDVADLVEESEVIVLGTVVGQKTLIDPVREQVVTRTTIRAKKTYFGPDSKEFTFQQWGGEWEGMLHKIPGDPTFTKGEEVVLFLNEGKGQYAGLYLTAMGQSKWMVQRDGEKPLIFRDLTDLGLVFDESAIDIEHKHREDDSLESFEAKLEALIAGIKGGSK